MSGNETKPPKLDLRGLHTGRIDLQDFRSNMLTELAKENKIRMGWFDPAPFHVAVDQESVCTRAQQQ
jgi:hypothetical protein